MVNVPFGIAMQHVLIRFWKASKRRKSRASKQQKQSNGLFMFQYWLKQTQLLKFLEIQKGQSKSVGESLGNGFVKLTLR